MFDIWHDSLNRLRIYCWETACRSFTPNFSVHPMGKTMRWIDWHLFSGIDVLLSPCKVWGDRTTRASCRCENVVFVFFCLSRSESGGSFTRAVYILKSYCVAICGSIFILFSSFFQKWLPFHISARFPSLGGATIFANLRSKMAKSPKIGGKVCAPHFV